MEGKGLEITDVPMPKIQPDEALVKVEATAICGTDVKIVRNGSRRAKPGQRLVLGHEFAGTIHEVGSAVRGLTKGMRVGVAPNFGCGHCEACIKGMSNMCAQYSAFGIDIDGSHTSYVRIPAAAIAQGNVVELPPEATWEEMAVAEPLSCVLNGQNSVNLKAGDTVLVYGAGPMGLLHVVLAAASGASRIIMADPVGARLGKASEVGATSTVDSSRDSVADHVKAQTNGRGVDVIFTAASVAEIVPEALQLLAPFGRFCLFAGLLKGKSNVTIDANPIHYKNLLITGTSGGCNADYRTTVKLIASRRVDVRPVISHVFPMSKIADAYAMASSGRGQKIVIKGE
jgi:threonine dehydrogenase-like Zn-dependent dehydrogenase